MKLIFKIFLIIIFIYLFSFQSLFAIKWCHDYSYYCVTGKNSNGKSPAQLRKELFALKYLPFNYRGIPSFYTISRLQRGDVVIFGEKHSGCVDSSGKIDHYIQKRVNNQLIQVPPTSIAMQDTLYHNWPINNVINFKRTHNPVSGEKLKNPVYPYRNVSVQLWKKVSKLIIKPAKQTIKVDETATFYIEAVFADGKSEKIKTILFTGKKKGTFAVQGEYYNRPAKRATCFVKEKKKDKKGKKCPENEVWNAEKKRCDCKEGYIRSLKDNKCKTIDEINEEMKEEDKEDPCENDIEVLYDRINEYKTKVEISYSRFIALSNKFFQQMNSQISNPCEDGIIAYCYTQALLEAEILKSVIGNISSLASEIIMTIGVCDLGDKYSINSLLNDVSSVKSKYNQVRNSLASMEGRLNELACDKNELRQLGDNITSQRGMNPDFLQDGGSMSEVPGDGTDQDADGLQDEGVRTLGGYNIVVTVFDSGPAKDDVFSISVSGQGNLGTTHKGALRSFGLNIPPGTYMATLTVISTEQGGGTFTIVVSQNGKRIAGTSGNSPIGGGATLNFTVTE